MANENWTEKQKAFHARNKYRKTPIGLCVICGKPAPWNDAKGHYERLCSDKCKAEYIRIRNARVKEKYGTSNLPAMRDFQRDKLMANRTIAKPYTHTDGTVYNVLSKLEYDALEYLDKGMGLSSSDIEAPMVTSEIKYDIGNEHKIHFPDIYIKSLNLIISLKDGLDNPNKHPNFQKDRAKNIAIYTTILKKTKYNYMQVEGAEIRIFDKLMNTAVHVIVQERGRFVVPPRIDYVMFSESDDMLTSVDNSIFKYVVMPNENGVIQTAFLAKAISAKCQLYIISRDGVIRIFNSDRFDVPLIVRDISKYKLTYNDVTRFMEDNEIEDMFNTVAGLLGYPLEDSEGSLMEEYTHIIEQTIVHPKPKIVERRAL